MGEVLRTQVGRVGRRQRLQQALAFAAWGAAFGAGSALAVAIAFALLGRGSGVLEALLLAILGPLAGFVLGYLLPGDMRRAAAAIDERYGLKDRASAALEFHGNGEPSDAHRLAMEDAERHLRDVDPARVVPLRIPKPLPYAAGLIVATGLALLLVPRPVEATVIPAEILAPIASAAERAEADLEELEEFAKESDDPELEKLVEELKKSLEEMKRPGVDLREALAQMSEMQAALEERQNALQTGKIDAQLAAIGQAMALAEPLADAGNALAAGKHDEAAEKLANLDAPALDRQTEKSVKEKLAALAKEMQQSGSPSLAKAAGEMSEGLGDENRSRFRDGAKGLAGEAKKQGTRNRLKDLLTKQCQCLGECKSQCEGECNSKSLAKKAGKGGKNWGLAASGGEAGEKTPDLGANREQRLTGVQSEDGDSEIETSDSPESEQQAQRAYRDDFEKYERLSEEALEGETIPLGHRQTIRRYFESIRPDSAEMDAVSSAEPEDSQ